MNKNFKFVFLIVFFLSFLISKSIFASVLTVDTKNKIIKTGDTFTVKVLLDTENNTINTVEGDLSYSTDILVENIATNDSFISFWVDQPKVNTENKIHFSGIVVGGIASNEGKVFSVKFKALKQGDVNIDLSNVNLYLNDGEATPDKTNIKNLNIKVSDEALSVKEDNKEKDTIAPEDFKIERTRNEYLYDNQNFIVFYSQDKGTGISHYEVCELFTKCIKAESPYLLKNQSIFYSIKVLAYDHDGNIKKSSLASKSFILVVAILLLILLSAILYAYYRSFKKNKL